MKNWKDLNRNERVMVYVSLFHHLQALQEIINDTGVPLITDFNKLNSKA